MELMNKDNLQILTGKTWDLHHRINEKITQNGFSFCSHCSNHGRYCVVSENTLEETEKMMAIRDSLKDLHDILIYLQRIKSNQKRQMEEALARLEESRKLLIQRINQYPERKLEVLEEMVAFLGDGKRAFLLQLKEQKDEKIGQKNVNAISGFLVHTTRFALEFAVIFASMWTTFGWCKSRQRREFLDTGMEGNFGFLLSDSDIHLDVFRGRG
ncbi:hypothetical protein CDL12_00700 [Handroanthus impetiginosus]|uniref:Uncharacterized protein n=1 Tax=Handroanthus impetiginosus TaxID=429701 RepID=A0A2G9IA48_9LAMI|nr:hypothetical protein CDL12_00700 [Handroanthus impetiginosus]